MTGLARGLWGVLATPFDGVSLEVDSESLVQHVRHHLSAGVTGLVALGVTGEAARMTVDEQALVAGVVAKAARGVPLVLGLSNSEPGIASTTAARLQEATGRSDAVFMVQVTTPDAEHLARDLAEIHRATGSRLVLQDYPANTGVSITFESLRQVLDRCDYIDAVKSEAPPTAVAIQALTAGTTVPVYGGLGGLGLLDELAAGAAGAMTGFSFPEAIVHTLSAWDTGGFPAARAAYAPWLPLVNFEAQPIVGLAIRKALLQERGIIRSGRVRPPGMPLPEALLPSLRAHLEQLPKLREATGHVAGGWDV